MLKKYLKNHPLLARKKTQLGLEICENQVRATLIHFRKSQPFFSEFFIADVQPNHQKSLVSALEKLNQSIHSKKIDTIIGLSMNDVVTKELSIDASLTDSDIEHYLFSHIKNQFNLPKHQVNIDFFKLPSENKNHSNTKIRVVAARREKITQIKNICTQAGFTLKAIDVEAFALTRMLMKHPHYNDKQTVAVIALHSNHLTFCVIKQTVPLFSKVENYLLSANHLPDEKTLTDAIQRALQYYMSNSSKESLNQILLIGDTHGCTELCSTISQTLNISTQWASLPTESVSSDFMPNSPLKPDNLSRFVFCSSGLALWGHVSKSTPWSLSNNLLHSHMSSRPNSVNLMPWRHQLRRKQFAIFLIGLFSLPALITLTAFGVNVSLTQKINNQKNKNKTLSQLIAIKRQETLTFPAEKKEYEEFKQLIDLFNKNKEAHFLFFKLIGKIKRLLPLSAHLTWLEAHRENWILQGDSKTARTITQFVKQLNESTAAWHAELEKLDQLDTESPLKNKGKVSQRVRFSIHVSLGKKISAIQEEAKKNHL